MVKYILGIDPSLRFTGVCLLKVKINKLGEIIRSKVLETDCFTSTNAMEQHQRIITIVNKIHDFIRPYNINVIGTENCFVGVNRKAALNQSELIGVIWYSLRHLGNDKYRIDATTAKKRFTGDGKATKTDIIKEVEKKFNMVLGGDKNIREAQGDAIAIACTAAYLIAKEIGDVQDR